MSKGANFNLYTPKPHEKVILKFLQTRDPIELEELVKMVRKKTRIEFSPSPPFPDNFAAAFIYHPLAIEGFFMEHSSNLSAKHPSLGLVDRLIRGFISYSLTRRGEDLRQKILDGLHHEIPPNLPRILKVSTWGGTDYHFEQLEYLVSAFGLELSLSQDDLHSIIRIINDIAWFGRQVN